MAAAEPQQTLPIGLNDLASEDRVPPEVADDRRKPPAPNVSAFYDADVEIPGYGHEPARCVPLSPVGFCMDHGHVMLGRSSCSTRYCPEHWRDWVKEGTINDVARLAAYRHVQDGWGKRLNHIAAIYAPERTARWGTDDLFDGRRDAYDALRDAGVRGGALYVHPYDTSDGLDLLFRTAVDEGDFNERRGKWAFVREISDSWGEAKGHIEPRAHYHTLAAAEDVDPDAAPDDWIITRIRSFDRFDITDLDSYRDMASAAWYVRTHSASISGRRSLTWWGDVHPSSFDPDVAVGSDTWEEIKEMAERAVTTRSGEPPSDGSIAGVECPHEDCESQVVPIERLDDWMDNDNWFNSLRATERNILRGVRLWIVHQGDRPPPGRLGSEDAVLSWCEERGRSMRPQDMTKRPSMQQWAGNAG